MKIKNIKISSLLIFGLFISVSLVLTLGIIAIQQNSKLQQQTETFFDHPYQVRLAIGKINADIQHIRAIHRDLFLNINTENNEKDMEVIYADIHAQFDILKSQYLGLETDVEKAYNSYLKWKTAITESIEMVKSGQKENALNELTANGKIRILKDEMIANLNVIDKFALNKAASLNSEAKEYADSSNINLTILIIVFLLVSIISNISLYRTIRKPIKELINTTELFHDGDLDARTSYNVNNEFKVLSDSWNKLAESIQIKTAIDEKFAKIASLMLSEYDIKTFFLSTLNAMATNTNSQMAAIYLLSDDKKTFTHFESLGVDNNARQSFAADAFEGEFGAVIQSRKVQHLKNIPENTRFVFHTVSGKFIPHEIITLPIIANNEVLAIISLATINSYNEEATQLINRIIVTLSARVEGILAFHQTKEYAEKLDVQNRELETQKTELEQQSTELTEQNTELEMQKKQLSEASNLKTNFLSNMSHELRTPLNSVIALSGVLNRRLANKIPAEEYSYLDVIERNGKHLLDLINDILDISRIEAGREEMEITEFNVNSSIDEVISMIKPQAVEKNIKLIHLNHENQLLITNDAGKCRHILQNLIGNAVKFTEKGKVEITATQNQESIIISITDTGIGIAENHLPHIFDEFRQADGSTSRRFGGTGLGLAIAQKYAMLLGGSISVKSLINKGSAFTLSMPLHYAAENRIIETKTTKEFTHSVIHAKYKSPVDTTVKTILMVEDSDAAIIQMKDMLDENGYQLLIARNGSEALDTLSQTIPDAIILDLMMPGIDGFDVLKNIRETEASVHIPVLILTAKHITKEELSFLKSNNIYQLIQKGNINRSELLTTVASMVSIETTNTNKPEREFLTMEGKPLVVVVENNPDNMITAKAILANKFIVIEAIDAVSGIEMTKKHNPNLILMDIGLPGMDGIEAFNIIRNDVKLQHIPVIALTASAMIADRETILSHGFDAYIAKPIDEKLFFKTINETLYGK